MRATQFPNCLWFTLGLVPLAGCLASPDNPLLLSSMHQTFTPRGWTDKPLEKVELEGWNPDLGWITVRSTRSTAQPTSHDRLARYLYQMKDTQIPAWGWSVLPSDQQRAKLRMVGQRGETLWTSQVEVPSEREAKQEPTMPSIKQPSSMHR